MAAASRIRTARAAALVAIAACSHGPARPTLTGSELYAQVTALQANGRASVATARGPIEVRREQALVTSAQVFLVGDVVARCRGGDPEVDVDCTLALLRDQRFELRDQAPVPRAPHEASGLSFRGKVVIAGVAIAAPLTYGAIVCSFPGCDAVFGVPLVLDAGFMLLALLAH